MRSKNQIKVVLTGGHAATTAISVVEEIKRRSLDWQLYWIGPKYAIEGASIQTSASRILPTIGVNFKPIIAGRLQKKWTIWTVPALVRVPIGFIHAAIHLTKIRPKVILSFGGYSALPVVVMGWLMRIPVIVHAQTVVVGLANMASVYFARKIAISRKESKILLPEDKITLTGNPVMKSITAIKRKAVMGSPPTIYVTGGSTGSRQINRIIDQTLENLLKENRLIHQTGEIDFPLFLKRKKNLESALRENYEIHAFIEPEHMHRIYNLADIIISRAGANTISEIAIIHRPVLLIPHPKVNFDEQLKNADLAQQDGFAKILFESELTPNSFLSKISEIKKDWQKIVRSENKLSKLDTGAAGRIVDLIQETLA